MDTQGTQQWHKRMKYKTTITSRKQEDTEQDSQTDPRAGGHKDSCWFFHETTVNKCQEFLEGPAPSQVEEDTADSLHAFTMGALATL
jgi:hypothetical protein